MALLSTQAITLAGLAPVYSAVAASDTFRPGDHTFLHVKNAGGSPDSVVVADPNTASPVGATSFNAAVTVSVPATTGDRMIGPFPAARFAAAGSGLVTVTHSFQTSVTAAVLTT